MYDLPSLSAPSPHAENRNIPRTMKRISTSFESPFIVTKLPIGFYEEKIWIVCYNKVEIQNCPGNSLNA